LESHRQGKISDMNYQSLLDKYESQRSARENYEVLKSNEFVNSILEENKKLKKQVNDLSNLVKEIFEELKESKKHYEDKLVMKTLNEKKLEVNVRKLEFENEETKKYIAGEYSSRIQNEKFADNKITELFVDFIENQFGKKININDIKDKIKKSDVDGLDRDFKNIIRTNECLNTPTIPKKTKKNKIKMTKNTK
jgi:hypothetical protein